MNPFQQMLVSFVNSKYQIPQGMTDPDEIINYLLQNGKITQEQYNQARMQMRNMEQTGRLPSPNDIANLLFRR